MKDGVISLEEFEVEAGKLRKDEESRRRRRGVGTVTGKTTNVICDFNSCRPGLVLLRTILKTSPI